MKRVLAILALALTGFVSGCSPVPSISPLYTEEDLKKPVLEPRIEGEWNSPNSDDSEKTDTGEENWLKWKITAPSSLLGFSGNYSAEFRLSKPETAKEDWTDRYDVRLVAIGDKLFFDAEFRKQINNHLDLDPTDVLGLVAAHLVGRIWVQQDFLRVAFLQPNVVEETGSTGFYRHSSTNYGDTSIVITGSTEELRNFLVRNADNAKALVNFVYLCRPGTDCGTRATEDALARTPDDDAVLEAAAKFFFSRGNYTRSVQSRKRLVELDPTKFPRHTELGEACLFARDFAAARKELAASQKIILGDPPAATDKLSNYFGGEYARVAEDLVWSYFLAGEYSEAVNAAKSYKPDLSHLSVNPLLLRYFSLMRLGQRTEAQAFLKEESAEFRGPAEDQVLLLNVQGRVIGGFPHSDSNSEALRRGAFFNGLRDIATGHAGAARLDLGYAASEHSNSLLELAAKIELERLGPEPKK